MKVLIEREQRVGLQLPKHAPEFLFDPIDGMEESAPVNSQFARTQLPVRAQKKMIPKQLMLEFSESSSRNQAEIRDIFLVFTAPTATPAGRAVPLIGNIAEVLFFRRAQNEPPQAHPENRAENALARLVFASQHALHPESTAI